MPVTFLQPSGLHPTPGYSHAVALGGRLLIVSGQVALDAERRLIGGGDFEAQAAQVFDNLLANLATAGAGARDVVRLGVILTDRANVPAYRAVRDRYFAPPYPASTLIIAGLVAPDLLIEVEAIAHLGD